MPFAGLLIFLLLFCGALIWVMYRVLGSQANQATERLMGLSSDYEKRMAELKKLAQDNELKASKLVSDAQLEAERVKKQAVDDAEQNREKLLSQARIEAERIVKDAVKAREAFRQELAAEMQKKTIVLASRLVLEVLPVQARMKVHEYWLEELLEKGLAALDSFESHEKIETVEVLTAFALDDGQRKKIIEGISRRLGASIPLSEKVSEDLVAGLRITLGHLVLEGTLDLKLKEAVQHAEHLRP